MNRLQTIDADTLQSTAYEPMSFLVNDLLPQGLHLLADAPKIGKSWLALEFDGEDHVWKLLSDNCEQAERPNERLLFLLSELLRQQPEISAPAKVLMEKIDPAGVEGLTPNSFSHRIRKSVDALRINGITVSFRKSNGDRLICLKRVDGVDDSAAENIVTIAPEKPPCSPV